MPNLKLARPMLIALAACAANFFVQGSALADDAQENKALKEQMRQMMQRMDALQKQVEALSRQQAAPPVVTAPPPPPPQPPAPVVAQKPPKPEDKEPMLTKILSGFYGRLDTSFDVVSKGIDGLVAYPYSLVDPTNPNSGAVRGTTPKSGPVGRLGYQPAFSTNKSAVGYRGSHKINDSLDLIYQAEAYIAFTAAPGLSGTWTSSSNVVRFGLGYGDAYVGFRGKPWGSVKVGTVYAPYRQSTQRMNPFAEMLGDYNVIMANSGGDNRVEFGTRLEHSIMYESPKLFGNTVNFDLLFSPGQNRSVDNTITSSGSPDCNGGNSPGSGNLLLNCDDGGFDNAFSADIRFESGPFYATAAYELHKNVNRNSDGIGANNLTYGYLAGTGTSPYIDFAGFASLPPDQQAVASPAYLGDIGDESAVKIGAQYKFGFGLTVNAIAEYLKRDIPAALKFQNERQRMGYWFAVTQALNEKNSVSAGWAHAGKTPGDPGGQHNYNPTITDNHADMFALAYKYKIDKQLTWYLDSALTINHGNAHYDLGAGGRGIAYDCHDANHATTIDYSGAGPTTWGGCRLIGFSTGIDYRF
jgi:predicted porin